MKNHFRTFLILAFVTATIGCDQVTKTLVREKIAPHQHIELMNGSFILTKVENKGAFFGLGENLSLSIKNLLLSALPTVVVLILLGFTIRQHKLPLLAVTALCFMVGGGIGNIVDRIAYGSVTDFLHIDLGFFRTGVFNMADVSILVGMFAMICQFVRKPPVE